jgi:NADH-quinone oxidoreductase subunit N
MFFGQSQEDALDHRSTPVLTAMLMASAIIMIAGIALKLFGVDSAAMAAAATLVQ